MTFINLSLLAGTALVALPVVLHLLMRRKPRLLEFPALRFVRLRHDANRRQLRLRHLLLLLLRMAIIALVAWALARPSVKFSAGAVGSQRAPVAAAMIFDTSKRMDYRHENRTRLDVAEELGLWLLAQFPPESQVAVLTSRPENGAFQVDLGAAKHRIERLETSANVQPELTPSIEAAVRLLSSSELAQKEMRKEIYIFTDLARVAWPAQSVARLQDRLGQLSGAGVYVIDVGVAQTTNFALSELRLSAETVSNRSPLRIEAELSSAGVGGKRSVGLFLLEPDPKSPGARKPASRGQQTIELQPGQAHRFELSAVLPLGCHQGYVEVLGQDNLAVDDRRFFTVEVKPPWPILVAAPPPEILDASKRKKDYSRFLVQALQPTEIRLRGEAPFECTVIAEEKLAEQDLKAFAAVCLVDPKPLDAVVWKKLAEYVADGHGLAVFLGRNAQPATQSFNEGPAQSLLAGKLLRLGRSPDESLLLAPRNLEHPVLSEFRRVAEVPWLFHPVYRYWQLGSTAEGVHVIAPFSNDDPAILERAVGKGRAITMTTPVSDEADRTAWNLLPTGDMPWPFPVLAKQMFTYLAGSGSQQFNYSAGQTAVLELDPRREHNSYVMTGPDNVDVRLTPDMKQQRLVVTSTDQPGNYRIQAGGGENRVDRGFSVNVPPRLTQLERMSDRELAGVFGPVAYRLARNKDEIEMDVSTGRVGRELFPLLILAAALVLGLEHVMANRFYKEG